MSNLCLLLVCSITLVVCDIIWTTSQYGFQDDPKVCACYCSDESMTYAELSSKVKYKGLAERESSCTCEDFLAPKLKRYILAVANETCAICKCNVESNTYCKDGRSTFYAKYQTVTLSVVCVTLGLSLINAVAHCFSRGLKCQSRRGYERMVEYNEESQPTTVRNVDFWKRIEKMYYANNELKLQYQLIKEKLKNGKTTTYSQI